MPVTLFPEIDAVVGVAPNCVHVPPDGLGANVVEVVNVLLVALAHANVWSLPALGLGFTVTTTFAVSLQPDAFCATNTYVVVVVGFTDVGVVTDVPLAVPIVHTGLE